MNYLEWDIFCDLISELEQHYNKQLTKFVKDAWYDVLKRLNEDQLYDAMRQAVCSHEYMPTANQLLECAGCDRFPGEQPQLQADFALLSLPSTEANLNGLTLEQRLENIAKLREITQVWVGRCSIRNRYKNQDKELIEQGFDTIDARFEQMRKLFHSEDKENRQAAIAWVKNQDHVTFIYANDGDLEPSDMELLDKFRDMSF